MTPNIQIGTVIQGTSFNVTRTGTNENPVLNFTLVKGDKGDVGQTGPVGPTGNGISSIRKTGTSGLVDTYTITYTNGNTTTFTITNGEDGEVTETELNVLRQKVADQQKVIDQLPQVTGQGTEVTLEDTIEAPFTQFDVEGNSEQETTEGIQLLKYPYAATTTTVKGVTFTDNGDGSLKINGTASEEARFNLQWDNKVPAGSYTYIVFNLPNNCFANYYTIGNKYGENVGNRTSDTEINLGSSIVVPAGVTVSNVTVYPMLVSGTYTRETIPNWEKYTNGASPNPNYEQPIESAGDNENLFDIDSVTSVIRGQIPDENKVIYTNENTSGNFNVIPNFSVLELKSTTYFISMDIKRETGSLIFGKINDGNSDWTLVKAPSLSNDYNRYIYKKTYSENTSINRMLIQFVGEGSASIKNIKLEQGNKASGYSPYGMGSITEKIVNRNWLIWELPYTVSTASNIILSNIPELEVGENYYFVGKCSDGTELNSSNCACVWHEGNTQLLNKNPKVTFTGIDISSATGFYIYVTSALIGKTISEFMLVKGTYDSSNVPDYVPHEEQDYSIYTQQPFRSNKDKTIRDCFVKVNGNWFERHYIGEKILNGTENWEIYNTHIYLYDDTFKASVESNDYVPNYKCNYFIPDSLFNANSSPNGKILQNVWGALAKHKGIAFNSQDAFSDVATLKTWLSTHNVIVQYELAEPLDLPCTETQIQQLENKPSTYKDFTIIQSEDATEAYLEVSGIYDLNNLINN